ncbi:hypothetical protein B296_00003579 [Ensete ventricosum]|uniref:Major facilitator superfamily (MFS) profile domain-containing protein n=1 Tax=Ensete ventricosum TaxID=4639 RepID=A0A426ZJV4_ENSVE|nr:hypothetical protein B296_00003579 [Ensete ventricosum]
MISHGADQFGRDDPKKLSTYFNAAYFSFCVGELIALTVLVWVQTRSGMDVGFGVSAGAMAMGLIALISGVVFYRNKPPQGSIFTPIARVFVAAISKRKQVCPSTNSELIHHSQKHDGDHHRDLRHTGKFRLAGIFLGRKSMLKQCAINSCNIFFLLRFLDKACIKAQDGSNLEESPWRLCTATEVEQVKVVLSVIPIFACTITFNTILAQLQTFSVQQGSSMDTRVGNSFTVPPASFQAIPYMMLIVLVPIYETGFVPLLRRFTGVESGITPLQRIGVGLFTVTFSMVSAALIEKKRREEAVGPHKHLSIFWIAPQFLVFGLSEMFTAVGLIEFFYKQSAAGMQSFLTAMTYCSYSFGFFLSSLLVSLVNKITSSSSSGGWLSDNDLNKDRLDLFYWLLAALSLLNFVNYLFWARWYSTSPSLSTKAPNNHGPSGEASLSISRFPQNIL